jgi:hypothetical protein
LVGAVAIVTNGTQGGGKEYWTKLKVGKVCEPKVYMIICKSLKSSGPLIYECLTYRYIYIYILMKLLPYLNTTIIQHHQGLFVVAVSSTYTPEDVL